MTELEGPIVYKYSTKGAITVSVADVAVPEAKKGILAKADEDVDKIINIASDKMKSFNDAYKEIEEILND